MNNLFFIVIADWLAHAELDISNSITIVVVMRQEEMIKPPLEVVGDNKNMIRVYCLKDTLLLSNVKTTIRWEDINSFVRNDIHECYYNELWK